MKLEVGKLYVAKRGFFLAKIFIAPGDVVMCVKTPIFWANREGWFEKDIEPSESGLLIHKGGSCSFPHDSAINDDTDLFLERAQRNKS